MIDSAASSTNTIMPPDQRRSHHDGHQPLAVAGRIAVSAIMDAMAAIDATTRAAVTERVTTHVRSGWPHLDDPIITFRSQFCYIALPGRTCTRWFRRPQTEPPSPVLCLRYQGHIDR